MSPFAKKPTLTVDALSAAIAEAGDSIALQVVKDGDNFVRKSAALSFKRCLSQH